MYHFASILRPSVDSPVVSFADATIARLPQVFQPYAQRHHEFIKFAIVGGTTFIVDSVIFYTLKLTILETKPVTAKVIAGIVAVIASYVLNRSGVSATGAGVSAIMRRCCFSRSAASVCC
jgi:putative flippase GtrA